MKKMGFSTSLDHSSTFFRPEEKHAMPSEQRCRLLAGPAAAGAQLSLVLVVLAALLLRRARERPRRDTKVFAFDVTKQFVSSGAAHFSGLAFSILAAAAAAAAAAGGGGSGGSSPQQQRRQEPSECGWYLVLFSVDTVAGSALAILLHRAAVAAAARWLERAKRSERRAARLSPPPPPATSPPSSSLPKPEPPPLARFAAAVARCGDYGAPPRLDLFLPQLAEWTCSVVAARLCCGFAVWTWRKPLSAVAAGVDDAFSSSSRPSVELFSVMLVGPLLMNAAQALVQDGVLRAKRGGSAAAAGRAGGGAGAGATAAAMAEEANGEGEGAELLPSPPARSSSSASPFSHHP